MNRFNCVSLSYAHMKYEIYKKKQISYYTGRNIKVLKHIGYEFSGDIHGSAYGADFLLLIESDEKEIMKEKLNGLKIFTFDKIILNHFSQRESLPVEEVEQYFDMVWSTDKETRILAATLILKYFSYKNLEYILNVWKQKKSYKSINLELLLGVIAYDLL